MPAIHSAAVEHHSEHPAAFRWRVRVYFEDTDAAGIVYYANYLKFFERCRTEWLRSFGIDQRELALDQRVQFVVVELTVQYQRPARLDDELEIDATVAEQARSWLVFSQQARRGRELLASARVKVACVDTTRMAPTRLPQQLLDRLAAPSEPANA
jgi:acyl-CoA thioester hydrolase